MSYCITEKALRLIANTSYNAHSSFLFYNFRCLKLLDLVKFCVNNVMYKAYNNLLPDNLQCQFTKALSVHKYNTRQHKNLYQKYVRTDLKYKTVTIGGVNLFNELPSNVKTSKKCFGI